jgi:hypothetical protein
MMSSATIRKKRTARLFVAGTFLAGAAVVVPAPNAWAACAMSPAVNPISIGELELTPAVAPDIVGVCAEVVGNADPEVGTDVTVEPGLGCGIPCFVVAWDGVTITEPITISITVYVGGSATTVERTVPAGSSGQICLHAGMPCP